ncbi:hypothetical protein QB910_000090 [Dabrowskivirus KKP3916]|uniref:Single-stranded DNA-binding protein n=1 Tax=Alicyclobacillus phage KKP_3916 TaxID=3040651 RepID=A0AAT9V7M5_9CAUD|nr:hypothetical protein QB910_000090 [Alicyclobacillus phage KKP 3916]
MAEYQEPKLKETKGEFTLIGIVKGLGKEKAFREGLIKQGKNKGKAWQSIKFRVQTSDGNEVYVQLMDRERDQVTATKGKKDEKESKKIPWNKRKKLPEGFHVFGFDASIEPDPENEGKYLRKNMHPFDGVDYIKKYLSDGDSVVVSGFLEPNEYEGQNGIVRNMQYNIRSIRKLKKPVDFESEKFEETSSFQQNVIFDSADYDEELNKAVVNAYIVNFAGQAKLAQFTIDGARKQMIKTFTQNVSFGDTMNLFGLVVNRTVYGEAEVEPDEDEDDPFGSDDRPKGTTRTNRTYIRGLYITRVEDWEQGTYSEEDFEDQNQERNYGEDKTTVKEDEEEDDDPFADDDDDDLPF